MSEHRTLELHSRKARSDGWHGGNARHYWITEAIPIDTLKVMHNLIAEIPISGIVSNDETAAKARFIVTACNAHDDLVAACEALLEAWEGYEMLAALDTDVYNQAKAAVQKARPTDED